MMRTVNHLLLLAANGFATGVSKFGLRFCIDTVLKNNLRKFEGPMLG